MKYKRWEQCWDFVQKSLEYKFYRVTTRFKMFSFKITLKFI